MTSTYILTVDPGLLTGVALVQWKPEIKLLWSKELDWDDLRDELHRTIHQFATEAPTADLEIVCEKFIITPKTGKNSQATWSIEVIGMLRCLAGLYKREVSALQKPSDALDFVSNDRLRAFSLWHKGGKGHANDALRHAILYMANNGMSDRRLLGSEA